MLIPSITNYIYNFVQRENKTVSTQKFMML